MVTESGELVARLIQDTEEQEEASITGPAKREKIDNSDSIKEEEEESNDDFKMPKAPGEPEVDRTPPETFTGKQVVRWSLKWRCNVVMAGAQVEDRSGQDGASLAGLVQGTLAEVPRRPRRAAAPAGRCG